MKFIIVGFIIVSLLILPGCSSTQEITNRGENRQTENNFEATVEVNVQANYLLYLPKNYNNKNRFPLLMFLHGAGERGNDLELVKKHGPPKLIEEGKDFPFIIVSPQCPLNSWWPNESTALFALIDDLCEKLYIDEEKIYLTGLSMGGYGTWAMAINNPDRFAAILPICGGGDVRNVCKIGRLPVWAFHGAKDAVVPLKESQDLVDKLKSCNGNVEFTVYPEANHDSWTETYNNQKVYEWLLSNSRTDRK